MYILEGNSLHTVPSFQYVQFRVVSTKSYSHTLSSVVHTANIINIEIKLCLKWSLTGG